MKAIITSLLFLARYGNSAGYDYDELGADWYQDYPMCATSDQSPINIQSAKAIVDESVCSKSLNWTIDWSIHSWKIGNNGHSIALQPVRRADWDPDLEDEATVEAHHGQQYTTLSLNENSIARLPNYFKPEGSLNEEFCLHSFHFHWGRWDFEGSEHLLDDDSYPLEVHFVHYSCRHTSLGTTLSNFADKEMVDAAEAAGDDTRELAVVGIFFEVTEEENPAFEAILGTDTLEKIKVPSDTIYEEVIDDLYLQDIIPDGVFTDGYYAYEGSLTTPPCTNIVRWHVSNTKSYIGKKQMARFRQIMATNTTFQAPNYREPQVNTKKLYACMAEADDEEDVVSTSEEKEDRTQVTLLYTWAIIVTVVLVVLAGYCYFRNMKKENDMEEQTKTAMQLSSTH